MDILRMAGDVFKDVRRQTEMSDVPAGTPGRFAGQGQVKMPLGQPGYRGNQFVAFGNEKDVKKLPLIQRTT